MSMNRIVVTAQADWEAAGLPGRPMVINPTGADQEFPVSNLVTTPDGEAILLKGTPKQADHATEAIADYLKRKIEQVYFFHPSRHIEDVFAFGVRHGRRLIIPERTAVTALSDHCSRYRPALRADERLQLPRLLHEENEYPAGVISDFLDESRAFQLAEVCEDMFDVDAFVVADGSGWVVVIDDDEYIDADHVAEMRGVCRLLQDYTVTPAPIDDYSEAPEIRRAWRERKATRRNDMARTVTDINARLLRIEAAISGAAASDVMADIQSGRA